MSMYILKKTLDNMNKNDVISQKLFIKLVPNISSTEVIFYS